MSERHTYQGSLKELSVNLLKLRLCLMAKKRRKLSINLLKPHLHPVANKRRSTYTTDEMCNLCKMKYISISDKTEEKWTMITMSQNNHRSTSIARHIY